VPILRIQIDLHAVSDLQILIHEWTASSYQPRMALGRTLIAVE
jgi:hypothetical protein